MKIVIAPDSFKESLTALEVASLIEKGFKEVLPDAEYIKIPMADGGEGTVQSIVDALQGKIVEYHVTGPLGIQVPAFFGLSGDGETAVVEMAAASGLQHVPPERRNPLLTTSYGTGELISAALDCGAKHIILGIGGSATNDGGAGMIQALGGKLLNSKGQQIKFGGASLLDLSMIDLTTIDERIHKTKIEVACDVDNPLIGPSGASAIFGPQKGATNETVKILDKNLEHFADLIETTLKLKLRNKPGAGAAGGLGFGVMAAFSSAKFKSGVDIVLEKVDFDKHVKNATCVITGEGRIDSQTIHGKAPIGVARAAKKYNIPVIAITGALSNESEVVKDHGIAALFSIVPGAMTLAQAVDQAEIYTTITAKNIASIIKLDLLK
ncbi:glycerate kinase [Metabacillus crassostreae]|uniref:glycerate kinase n=1 Tax=Metabacillus crassostreae TaxID=929098 RepID=UPI00195731D9|nr:glycerate kinase [Metabacillus crassostreae]MBM7605518.1 glycerate kinase [Metabacillus crassostreae]